MKILVINCGSSSIKYQLFDMRGDDDFSVLAKGLVEKIGLPLGALKHKPAGKTPYNLECPVPDHTAGMQLVLDSLVDAEHGVISSFGEIDAVGHRIVQGADFFDRSVIVDESVMEKIAVCCDFAPLHNPAHILGIRAMQKVLPETPQAVVFDTAFHQTMEPKAYMYALPYRYYTDLHIRRYGAHGTSHKYISAEGARFAGLDLKHSRIVTCHIGNGSSVSAVVDGRCVDTSMGFTPLEGMIMGTRCGNIDASIVPYIMKKEGMTPDAMTDLLNKKSGFLGLTEQTSDCREVVSLAESGDERANLVLDKLVMDITKLVAGFIAEMGGVDLIVFAAGIAENNPWLRERVVGNLAFIGAKIDKTANDAARGDNAIISAPDSTVKVALIPTDEELMIARDTMHLTSRQ